ncbi:MAG: crossover junction endodeoxyribonuclease RuvC [Minisyncoccia bacterium]|jgi:crossover junction endodeoxyribonuclease RuvC
MRNSVTALGIDPGTRRIGYGVVRDEKGGLVFVTAGILKIKSVDDASALCETKEEIGKLVKKYKPEILGVEKLYFAKNQKTAIAVAQARGVILLAAQEAGIPIREYAPNEVKLGVTGYGFADKKAVLKMVRLILGKHDLTVIDDASDALALAIMALGGQRISGD